MRNAWGKRPGPPPKQPPTNYSEDEVSKLAVKMTASIEKLEQEDENSELAVRLPASIKLV
jgi:hypothetical protein